MAKPKDAGVREPEEAPKPAPATPPKAETQAESPPVAQAKPAPKRFRVWRDGYLDHDGVRFEAGAELPLTEAEVAALNCPAIEAF